MANTPVERVVKVWTHKKFRVDGHYQWGLAVELSQFHSQLVLPHSTAGYQSLLSAALTAVSLGCGVSVYYDNSDNYQIRDILLDATVFPEA